MTLAVAYAIQEAALGGLDPATRKWLDTLAAQIVPAGAKRPPRPNRVKPGTRLIREWKGRVHEVTVVEDGFAWNGKHYHSLSVIARAITDTRWNGWVFFGLKQRQTANRQPSPERPDPAGSRSREANSAIRSPHIRVPPSPGDVGFAEAADG